MSTIRNAFEKAASKKFSSGYSYQEWYVPNRDATNFTIEYGNKTGTITIDSLTYLQNTHVDIQNIILQKLNEEFP